MNKHFLILARQPASDQTKNITGTQLAEPMTFIGVTNKSMSKGLLTGVEMTKRQLWYQNSLPTWVTAHGS